MMDFDLPTNCSARYATNPFDIDSPRESCPGTLTWVDVTTVGQHPGTDQLGSCPRCHASYTASLRGPDWDVTCYPAGAP